MLNIELKNVKCIIWDLDMTLWNGVLQEGNVHLSKERKALLDVIDRCGVIQTVCSKNNYYETKDKLESGGIWQYFISPMISYSSKAEQIQTFCDSMHFRFENCLFIDDNRHNCEEVKFYCPGIQISESVSELNLDKFYCDLSSSGKLVSRRPYYRILEQKISDKRQNLSKVDFLVQSKIQIQLQKPKPVHFERIYELITRTNQLNFTKKRIDRKKLMDLLHNEAAENYCVHARDKYGEYGVVGFTSILDGNMEHFLFSCRVLGMGIEQYVYKKIGPVSIDVCGEVAVTLNDGEDTHWISECSDLEDQSHIRSKEKTADRVLLKGPCDIRSVLSCFGNESIFDTEFTYTNNSGIAIEQINHTHHVVQSLREDRGKILAQMNVLPFFDPNMYSDKIFSGRYQAICYSLVTDSNLGLYRHKETDWIVAFGEYFYPLTDPKNWDDYISGKLFTANCTFTKAFLERFSEEYVFLGRISDEQFRENLRFICDHVPRDCQLLLITGVEIPYAKCTNRNYGDRYIHHRQLREIAEEVASDHDNVHIFSFASYVMKQDDFFEHYNHFQKYVYRNVALNLAYMLQCLGVENIYSVNF